MPCKIVERLPLKSWTVYEIPVLQNYHLGYTVFTPPPKSMLNGDHSQAYRLEARQHRVGGGMVVVCDAAPFFSQMKLQSLN